MAFCFDFDTALLVLAFALAFVIAGSPRLGSGGGGGGGFETIFWVGGCPRLRLTVMALPACTCAPGAGCCEAIRPAEKLAL